jgi:hypothetical protein
VVGVVYVHVQKTIRIPADGEPLTFELLKQLNPKASPQELSEVFPYLPAELKEQCWEDLRLRVALENWDASAKEVPPARDEPV